MFDVTILDDESTYTVQTQVKDRDLPYPITYREYTCAVCGVSCGITREVLNGECGVVQPCRHSDRERVNDMVRTNATAHVEALRTAIAGLEDTFTASGVSASTMDTNLDAIEDALHYLRNTVRFACLTETVIRVGPFLPTCSQCGDTVLGFSGPDSLCGDCNKNNEQKAACYEEHA
jgi:hypothetical protein